MCESNSGKILNKILYILCAIWVKRVQFLWS